MFALDQFKVKQINETATKGEFEISPLPRGFGQTLGNVLRRVLLSSIPGTAITAVKFKNIQHEYTTITNVQDDILTILLQLKQIALHSNSDQPVTLELNVKGKKGESREIKASDIEAIGSVEIVNGDQHITNLNGDTTLDIELTVERGVGFLRAKEDLRDEIGMIPLDADFNPVKNVEMAVAQTRVGQMTDLDKINLTIVTNGAVLPSVVLHQAAQVLAQMGGQLLNSVSNVMTAEPQGLIGTTSEADTSAGVKSSSINIAELGLSNRLSNALLRAGYIDLQELEGMADEEIANIKGMGAKSFTELKETLDKYGIKHI